MGRNNRDYKIKDKKLTKNKRNAKLNKSIAFTLASMATIGAGTMAGGQMHEAEAMLGRLGSSAMRIVTSRALTGAPGAINTGKMGSNGTQFKGLPKTVRSVTNNNFTTQANGVKRKLSTSSIATSNNQYGKNVQSLKDIFESTANSSSSLYTQKLTKKQSSTPQNGKNNTVITTQGFYRK